ncbi:MAG: Late embryosis abundant protein [Gemmatimonadetes bacterium]|nr:Late embryosis abundant protein [Gemmatimonadota bacterium]
MTGESGPHVGEDIGNAVESTLDDVAGRIREKGRKAVASIDGRRMAAADGLEGAARGLHDKADAIAGGGERLSKVTHEVADRVDGASRYIREKDARDMLADVESIVRAHPTRSLLAVLAIGFLAGRVLRRD